MSNDITVAQDQQQFMTLIERMATNKDVDVVKLNALLDMKDRMLTKHAEIEANEAFARVLKNMPRIKKSGMIEYNKPGIKPIPYGKWEDIIDAIRPIYEAENFTLAFDSEQREGGGITSIAILTHANGHIIKSRFSVPLDTSGGKQNVQGMGSSSSFANRYATRNMFNLVFEGEDDDGVKGGAVFITVEQQCQLNALMEETKTEPVNFLRMFEITSVENVEKRDFPKLMNFLTAKKAKLVKP